MEEKKTSILNELPIPGEKVIRNQSYIGPDHIGNVIKPRDYYEEIGTVVRIAEGKFPIVEFKKGRCGYRQWKRSLVRITLTAYGLDEELFEI